eukprot:3502683-Amphidinium_carterae.1
MRQTESLSSLWTPRPASRFRLRLMHVSAIDMLLLSWVTFTEEVIKCRVSLQLETDKSHCAVWNRYMEMEPEVVICDHVGSEKVD